MSGKDRDGSVRVTVEPADVLLDDVVRIRVTGLAPSQRVRVSARSEAFKAEGSVELISDDRGCVDLLTSAPVSGTYTGCDPMGLFWSAHFDDGVDLIEVLDALGTLAPLRYTVVATVDESEVGRADLVRRTLAAGVRQEQVRDGCIRGTLFSPAGAPQHGGVIVVGGSDGGNSNAFVAALLAARGFPALALAWFAYDDLPAQPNAIPLEYFDDAIAWLRARPEVAGARVGVVGTSLGGELALLLGATFPDIAAVVGIVPSGVIWDAKWTHRGAALPGILGALSGPETVTAIREAMERGTPASGTPAYLRALDAAIASGLDVEIPVERTRGPILLLSAEDDALWPSTRLADIVVDRLRSRDFGFAYEHRSYPGAGHLAFMAPYLPTTRDWATHPQLNIPVAVGGNPRASASAAADAWPRVVEFLRAQVPSARERRHSSQEFAGADGSAAALVDGGCD